MYIAELRAVSYLGPFQMILVFALMHFVLGSSYDFDCLRITVDKSCRWCFVSKVRYTNNRQIPNFRSLDILRRNRPLRPVEPVAGLARYMGGCGTSGLTLQFSLAVTLNFAHQFFKNATLSERRAAFAPEVVGATSTQKQVAVDTSFPEFPLIQVRNEGAA